MRFTKQQVRQLRRDNKSWPLELKAIPAEQWPPQVVGHNTSEECPRIAVWRSREFLVQAFRDKGVVRLSVNRTDWDTNQDRFREDISWDELQRLKAEAGFANFDAVEVFPAEGDTVNVANMRHIWVLNEPLSFAWRSARQSKAA